ncbi:hypothetical protein ES703_15697 [subsurface metagenome]
MEKELVNYDFQSQLLEERKEKIRGINKMEFDEKFHISGRPEWIVDLYLEVDKFIMTDLKGRVRKDYLESYIKYSYGGFLFAYIVIRKGENIKVWAKIPYSSLGSIPLFVRDYEPVSRRVGVMITFDDQREFLQGKEAMLEVTFGIISKAFQGIVGRKRKVKTPLKMISKVEPVKSIEAIKPISLNISVGNNGDIEINLKIKKEQKRILERILEETILK